MEANTLARCIKEAERFVQVAKNVRICPRMGDEKRVLAQGIEAAAAKRASMDLTRALADLRQNR